MVPNQNIDDTYSWVISFNINPLRSRPNPFTGHSPINNSPSLSNFILPSRMPSLKPFATATRALRSRLSVALRSRGGGGDAISRWRTPSHEERPKGYLFNRMPPPAGPSHKWEDWELPCYITSFFTIVILGVGLNANPDLTIESWATSPWTPQDGDSSV